MVISENYVLESDTEVNNIKHTSGVLDLNGHTLKIHGDYKGEFGYIKINNGSIYCEGDFYMSKNQNLIMENVDDYLYVAGDTTFSYKDQYNHGIKNGTIELCGDLNVTEKYFGTTGINTIRLSGTKKQTLTIDSTAVIKKIELNNFSEEGVYIPENFACGELIRNNCNIKIGEVEGNYGYTLKEDVTIEGDYILTADTLDLNGHSFTVKGNLIQQGGVVRVNGGKLNIEGDYRIQTVKESEEKSGYGASSGSLRMNSDKDIVIVEGDFITSSLITDGDFLTAGVLRVKGNITVNTESNTFNFMPKQSHRIVLCGDKEQRINIGTYYSGRSRIANIDIENQTDENVIFENYTCITGNINDNGHRIKGYIVPDSNTTFTNNTLHGDLYVKNSVSQKGIWNIEGNVYNSSAINIGGEINVTGDYIQSDYGRLVMNEGKLNVAGNAGMEYTSNQSDILQMEHASDFISIRGSMTASGCTMYHMTAGTIEVGGDVNLEYFRPEKEHRFVLNGSACQKITLGDNAYFNILEIKNQSEEGIYSEKVIKKNSLIRNGCRLRYGELKGEFGWTLKADEEYEGNLTLLDEVLDLNGHTLTVKGDFIQPAGEVRVGGGKLIVEGDYRMQSVSGTEGNPEYGSSAGILNMTNPADEVVVKGKYINATSNENRSMLTEGTLTVDGDFEVVRPEKNILNNFYSTGNHTVVLNVTGENNLKWGYEDVYGSRISNLVVRGNGTLNIDGKPYVTGSYGEKNVKVTGDMIPGEGILFADGVFSGSLYLRNKLTVKGELNVGGDVYNKSGRIVFESGSLKVGGDVDCEGGYYTYGIEMTHEDDSMTVEGDFTYESYYTSVMKAGVLKVCGDFTAKKGFESCKSHKVILSGNKKQTIVTGENCRMGILELDNHSEEGVYAKTILVKDELITNGCRFVYENMEGEFGYTLTKDVTYEDDLNMIDGTMNLNGHTLTVKGNFIQSGGKIEINGGRLVIEGDYRQQTVSQSGTYGKSGAILSMKNGEDEVIIAGDYYSSTLADNREYMTDGTIKLSGNMTITEDAYSFYPAGNHRLILEGDREQTVSIRKTQKNVIHNLTINNTSEEGINTETVKVTGKINDISGNLKGTLCVRGTDPFESDSFTGNIIIDDRTEISGKAVINGNLTNESLLVVSGELYIGGSCINRYAIQMNGGRLIVAGNFEEKEVRYSQGLKMTGDKDNVLIKGNFIYAPYYTAEMSGGILEVQGDFTTTGLYATGTHRVVLSGDKKQTININQSGYFNILELKNDSSAGVYSKYTFKKSELITNGFRITYGDGDTVTGYTLNEDYVCEGDFVLADGTLDLNGHQMTVKGDFIHAAGELKMNNGSLMVEGDYRLQNRIKEDGEYRYSEGTGIITIKEEPENLCVKGDFIWQAYAGTKSMLENGTISISGDFIQTGYVAFETGDNAGLIFDGDKKQTVQSYMPLNVGNLENNNKNQLEIKNVINVKGLITDRGNYVTGAGKVTVTGADKIADGKWSGSVQINNDQVLDSDLVSGGTLTVEKQIDLNGHHILAGAVNVSAGLTVNGGSIDCMGDFTVGNWGRLVMTNANDKIFIAGDMNFISAYSHRGILTEGEIELQGHFVQDSAVNFVATENHRVVLSGTEKMQIIVFQKNAGDTRFAKLVLKYPVNRYRFENDLSLIADEVINEVTDVVPPKALTYIQAEAKDIQTVVLNYEKSEDESGIAGYRIYRDGQRIAVTGMTTYEDKSVKPGKTYEYKVYPYDICNNQAEDSPVAVATVSEDEEAPSVPGTPELKAVTGSSVTIRYTPSSDNSKVAGYEIYRDGEKICTTEKTVYKDSGLKSDTEYTYTVRAYDESGNISEYSESGTYKPVMPKITSVYPADDAEVGKDVVNLSVRYENNSGTESYRVNMEYKNSSGEWVQIPPTMLGGNLNGTENISAYRWEISKMNVPDSCSIRYTLYDADGNKDELKVRYNIDREAPQTPASFMAEPDNGVVILTWNPVSDDDCEKYEIYRKEKDGEYKLITECKADSNTYTDNKVTEGGSYTYAITASDVHLNVSERALSDEVTVSKDKKAPKVECILPDVNVIGGTKTILVKATDNIKVDEMTLLIKKSSDAQYKEAGTVKAVSGQSAFTLDTTGYEDGTYFISATATDTSGNVSINKCEKKYKIDNTGISKITGVNAKVAENSVTLSWDDVNESDLSYFLIEMEEDGEWKTVAREYNKTYKNIGNLKCLSQYTFRITGYDVAGNAGETSDSITVTTTNDADCPKIIMTNPEPGHVKGMLNISQTAEDNVGIEKAVFYYSTDGINYQLLSEKISENKTTRESFETELNTDTMDEGTVYIRCEAYDTSGNKSEEVVLEYETDRTAPESVKNLRIKNTNGIQGITWDTPGEDDISHYEIYRAKEGSSYFVPVIENLKTIGYYDTDTETGMAYQYKVLVVDKAGNKSAASEPFVMMAEEDRQAPVIQNVLPEEGVIGKESTIKVLATDNHDIKTVTLEYRKKGDEIWHVIGENRPESLMECSEFTWNTGDLNEEEYDVRAYAEDNAGNVSKTYTVTYSIDKTAPKKPEVTTKSGYKQIEIIIAGSEEKDFDRYEILKKPEGSTCYTVIASTKEPSYTDNVRFVNAAYVYKVRSYDKSGNYSESEEITGAANDDDTQAPSAKLPSATMCVEGSEIKFNAGASTDNVEIVEYEWDFGDGNIVKGNEKVSHQYEKPGTYTVILTVKDKAGNKSSCRSTAVVKKRGEDIYNNIVINVCDRAGKVVPSANISISSEKTGTLSASTDESGNATMELTAGNYECVVFKNGYKPKSAVLCVDDDGSNTFNINLESGSIINTTITTHRMSIDEIIASGVDLKDEENYNRVCYEVKLWFEETPIPVVYITGVHKHVKREVVKDETAYVSGGGGKVLEPKGVTNYTVKVSEVHNQPVLTSLAISQSVSWLKEMYNVTVDVTNESDEDFRLRDTKVNLNLPKELSFAKTKAKGTPSEDPAAMGEAGIASVLGGLEEILNEHPDYDITDIIREEEEREESERYTYPGETYSESFIVTGSIPGKYAVEATVEASLDPSGIKLTDTVEGECDIEINGGKGLKMTIYAEDAAYNGEDYYTFYELTNTSDTPVYNIEYSFEDPMEKERIKYLIPDSSTYCPETGAYEAVEVGILWPGDTISGTHVFPAGSVEDTGHEETYYQYIKSELPKFEQLLGMQVEVKTIGSHCPKVIYEYDDFYRSFFGDPIHIKNGTYYETKNLMELKGQSVLGLTLSYHPGTYENKEVCGEAGKVWSTNYESSIVMCNGGLRLKLNADEEYLFAKKEPEIEIPEEEKAEEEKEDEAETEEKETESSLAEIKTFGKSDSIFTYESSNVVMSNATNVSGEITMSTGSNTTSQMQLEQNINGMMVDYNNLQEVYAFKSSGTIQNDKDKYRIKYDSENSGELQTFKVVPDLRGEYVCLSENPVAKKYRLIKNKDFSYTVYTPDNSVLEYNAVGKLTKVTDAAGRETTFEYVENKKIITDMTSGMSLILIHNNDGLLTCIEDDNGRSASITYDENKCITSITDESGYTTGYTYNDNNRITKVQNNSNETVLENTYDEQGRVIRQTTVSGQETTYEYKKDNATGYTHITITCDGIPSYVVVNEKNEIIKEINQRNSITTYEYDEKGNEIRTTDGLGYSTAKEYNEYNNMTKQTDSLGRSIRYTYYDNGNLKEIISEGGEKAFYEYDEKNLTTKITEPSGRVKKYTYYDNGLIKTEEVEGLGTMSYEYENGRLTKQTDYNGNVTTIEYDGVGNIIKQTEPDGSVMSYTYDNSGRILTVTDAMGYHTAYTYDNNGYKASETDEEGNVTRYENDSSGNNTAVIYPDGSRLTYVYDKSGNNTAIVYPDGREERYTYDYAGNIVKKETADGNVVRYDYDILNQLISETDASGNAISYEYDAAGNITKKTYSDGGSEE